MKNPRPNPVKLTVAQSRVFSDRTRFRSLVAGRRFGKTFLALIELLAAVGATHANERAEPPVAWYLAPTYRQAKEVAWRRMCRLAEQFTLRKNETDLSITLPGGGVVALRGAERYDNLRGPGLDFVVLDEYADMPAEVWPEVVRPALSDRLGRALFIGTPKGFNHFHELHQSATDLGDWSRWTFTTEDGGLVPPSELEAARRDLDPKIYRQEYQASFEDLTSGRVYYAFSESNIRRAVFDPARPLILCCDFNINPMAWVLAQQTGSGRGDAIVQVIDEVVLPNSNTPAACDEFAARVEALAKIHGLNQASVEIYGDASGATRVSSGSPSDWEIIRRFFGQRPGYAPRFEVERSNPHVRDRVAAVNRLLGDIDGGGFHQRLFIDPRCRELIEDLRRVVWATDAGGNATAQISKKDPKRTHASDASGYYIHRKFGLRGAVGERAGLLF